MTFHKYLVTVGLLLAGWSAAWAADDTSGSGSAASGSDNASATSTGTHKSSHHRKHHGTAGTSTNAGAGDSGSAANAPATAAEGTSKTKRESSTTKDEAKAAKTASSAEPGTKGAVADANAHPTSRRHHHKGATSEAASGNGTSAQPAAAGAPASAPATASSATGKSPTAAAASHSEKNTKTTPPASIPPATTPAASGAAATAAAGAATTSTATVATEKQAGRHRRHHGKTTAPAGTSVAGPAATGTNAAPIVPPPATAKSSSTTPAVGAPATVTAATATTSSSASTRHRRHHGKSTTPEPIVVAPAVMPAPSSSVPAAISPAAVAPPSAAIAAPIVQNGLPVARRGSGTTASLPVGLGRDRAAASAASFSFTDYPTEITRPRTRTYPWKRGIITTVFWIGEGGSTLSATTNHASSWDMDWTYHNGGVDDPDEMSKKSGYSFDTHASTLNPFYIALPFNDLAYPDKARRWLPTGWYKPQRHGEKAVSACQGRWIEIKSSSGRVCYAQWEDVGPLVSDHAEYVFGPEFPTTLTRAGLDVSPSVAKYLGFEKSAALTSWRFVDDADVQPGLWLRYDEQAILFRALKEEMHPRSNPRMQDLDEPVPDGSLQDDSEKRAGAARG